MIKGLRYFSQTGEQSFREWLKVDDNRRGLNGVPDFLEAEEQSVVVDPSFEFEIRSYSTKWEMLKGMNDIIQKVREVAPDSVTESRIYTWLVAVHFQMFAATTKAAKADYRWIVKDEYNRRYKHLLLGAIRLYDMLGEQGKICFQGKPAVWGDDIEQAAARKYVLASPKALEMATKIFGDPESGGFRKGTLLHGDQFGVADFFLTWNQYLTTHELDESSDAYIREMLPERFRF